MLLVCYSHSTRKRRAQRSEAADDARIEFEVGRCMVQPDIGAGIELEIVAGRPAEGKAGKLLRAVTRGVVVMGRRQLRGHVPDRAEIDGDAGDAAIGEMAAVPVFV